jgi:hypothetical protein
MASSPRSIHTTITASEQPDKYLCLPKKKEPTRLRAEHEKNLFFSFVKDKNGESQGDWMRTVFMVFWAVEKYLYLNIVKKAIKPILLGRWENAEEAEKPWLDDDFLTSRCSRLANCLFVGDFIRAVRGQQTQARKATLTNVVAAKPSSIQLK